MTGRNRHLLLETGFRLEEILEDGSSKDYTLEALSRDKDFTTDLLSQSRNPPSFDESQTYSDSEDEEVIPSSPDLSEYHESDTSGSRPVQMRKRLIRVKYEDPWMIHAAAVYNQCTGRPAAQIISWNGDGLRIQDKLGPHLFGKDFASRVKNKLRFP
jgi:hypothetical protein